MQKTAYGVLHWRPHEFWSATPQEYSLAIAGHIEALTGKKKRVTPMTYERLQHLIAKEKA